MKYYFSRTLDMPFDTAVDHVSRILKEEGFGILSDIDVRAKMREKLGKSFRNYRILGACNPPFAWQALQVEDKIGTMLPCNVIVQDAGPGRVEVAAIDPVASMLAVENPELRGIGEQVRASLQRVIESL
jgi:uncharacterized protein (DUF302 family)